MYQLEIKQKIIKLLQNNTWVIYGWSHSTLIMRWYEKIKDDRESIKSETENSGILAHEMRFHQEKKNTI